MPARILRWLAMAAVVAVCCACAMAPEQRAAAEVVLRQLLDDGKITEAQFSALLAALDQGDWAPIRDLLVDVGLSLVGLHLGAKGVGRGVAVARAVMARRPKKGTT